MLRAALLAQVVLARPLVLDGRAELLLEIARQDVAARARMPLDGELHLARGIDVDEDRGTWHRDLLAGGKLLDHQLDVAVLLDPLQDAPASALDGADRGVDRVAVLQALEVRDVAPAPLEVVHADGLGRLDDDRVLPAGQTDDGAGVGELIVEGHAALLEREAKFPASVGEGLAVPEVNLDRRGMT